ncbi:response regulator [Algisphaera agarilytica]|uniref:CheY-like chemotaxis protein/GAF domain-containing protein n=1 Tax=Algisphaera agarilytica TaxID=1385975 RepID=A0A7X0H836_9BACT|nr:response regulator [Algisphaera agarilytica]MBB6431022.1 CheY-like chemotaxis protein/GAF domain-containing protein [Algisphaera agarilytica]
MSDSRKRVLIFGSDVSANVPVTQMLSEHFDVTATESIDEALAALRADEYHAVFAEAGDFLPLERGLVGDKSSVILNTIGEGVCIVDADGRMSWSNKTMRGFTPETTEHTKRICRQALQIFKSQVSAAGETSQRRSKKFTFQDKENYYEMICSPVINDRGEVEQVVAVVWDASSGKRLQSKIDAIDASGRELARIQGEAVASKTPAERLKLLQEKIIKYSKDLMHFDHFAIRLLDKRTNKLEVVIAEGLPPEALEIDLYAQPEGNGISGYVGATGRSYICHDVEKDPRYVLGLQHSKSSLTVPLMLFDEVIGVYNVESEEIGTFNEDDRQFVEIFGRYVAMALNILDLLVVERFTTSNTITDSVIHEIEGPLDQIVTESQNLMEEYIGDDAMRARLNKVLSGVESIRDSIKNVKAGPAAVIGCDKVEETQTDPLLHGKRILIADDEPNIRKTVKEVLSKFGCVCTTAKDGYEACSLLDQDPFDLVISDIKMPYRNGYEIYASAQRAREGMPVVLMTGFGYDPHHSIVRASQEGLSTVLFKPFKVDQFLEEVRKALDPATQDAATVE